MKDLIIAARASDPEDDQSMPPQPVKNFDTKEYDQHRAIGSPSKPCTLQEIEDAHRDDNAFKELRKKLGEFMTWFLPHYGIPLPGGKTSIRFRPTDMVRYR